MLMMEVDAGVNVQCVEDPGCCLHGLADEAQRVRAFEEHKAGTAGTLAGASVRDAQRAVKPADSPIVRRLKLAVDRDTK